MPQTKRTTASTKAFERPKLITRLLARQAAPDPIHPHVIDLPAHRLFPGILLDAFSETILQRDWVLTMPEAGQVEGYLDIGAEMRGGSEPWVCP